MRDDVRVARKAQPPPQDGVIDITGWYPAPNEAVSILRIFVLGMLWLAVSAGWLYLCILPVAQADGGVLLVVLGVVGVAPFVYGIVWLFRRYFAGISGLGRAASAAGMSRRELDQPVPGTGVTVGQVLLFVESFARGLGPAAVVRGTAGQRARALMLRLGGLVLLLGAVVIGATRENLYLLPPVLIAGGLFAFLRASQTAQPKLARVLAKDARRPILLLRSFKDDVRVSVGRPQRTPVGTVVFGRRLEQAIAAWLTTFGPLIAIGNPGEKLPQIGAARAYLSDDEWQPQVLQWMDDALFIIMMAGATPWITWELHRIVERGHAHQLFIVVPPRDKGQRWPHVVESMRSTPWFPALDHLDPTGLLVVRLLPDGWVRAVRSRGRGMEQDYQLALAISVFQAFRQQGGAPSTPPPATV